jgi:hypothetical protein
MQILGVLFGLFVTSVPSSMHSASAMATNISADLVERCRSSRLVQASASVLLIEFFRQYDF